MEKLLLIQPSTNTASTLSKRTVQTARLHKELSTCVNRGLHGLQSSSPYDDVSLIPAVSLGRMLARSQYLHFTDEDSQVQRVPSSGHRANKKAELKQSPDINRAPKSLQDLRWSVKKWTESDLKKYINLQTASGSLLNTAEMV